MLEPKMISIPDFSAYIGKEFQFDKKFSTGYNFDFFAGLKFKIKKIKNSNVTIKITSSIEEAYPTIRKFADNIIKDRKDDIEVLDKIIKIWSEEKNKFEPIPNHFWNEPREGELKGGHCINTGYNFIPKTHPDVWGMATPYSSDVSDTIMTLDYRHKGGKKNIYYYQEGQNEWYSQTCYEFMRLGCLDNIKKYTELDSTLQKRLYKSITDVCEFKIKKLNKGSFHLIN